MFTILVFGQMKKTVKIRKVSFIILCFMLTMFSDFALCQNQENIKIIANPSQKSIRLRWIPTNYSAWKFSLNSGYKLERITVLKNGIQVLPVKPKIIGTTPFKISSEKDFEKYSSQKYPLIAAECIFDSDEESATQITPQGIFKKYNSDMMKFSVLLFCCDMDTLTAGLSGLYYEDFDVRKNEKYVYRITFFQQDSLFNDTAYAFCGLSGYTDQKPCEKPEAYFDGKSAVIYLNTIGNKDFNCFFVERSNDGGDSYQRLNSETPVVKNYYSEKYSEVVFRDTSLVENQKYLYRIIGVDSFAEESLPSESVEIQAVAKINGYADFTACYPVDNNSVVLEWQFSEKDKKLISGFKIYRSSSPDSVKDLIYSGLGEKFVDKNPFPDNYYYISVFNGYEEKLNPFPSYAMLIDSIPPAKPDKPHGFCDSLGRVFLSWENTDIDVKGFRLFYAENLMHEFVPCLPSMLKDTFYVDTISLKTLSKSVYYRLVAVDGRDNQSVFSDILEVKRFDTVPPPVIRNFDIVQSNGKLKLIWQKSSADDVVKYIVFKKSSSDNDYRVVAETGYNTTCYKDKDTINGECVYGIVAVDGFGNKSDIYPRIFKENYTEKQESVDLKIKKNADVIRLLWAEKSGKNIKSVIVYRSVNGSPLRTYKYVKGNVFEEKISVGESLTYCVKIIYTDDMQSLLSNEVYIEN